MLTLFHFQDQLDGTARNDVNTLLKLNGIDAKP